MYLLHASPPALAYVNAYAQPYVTFRCPLFLMFFKVCNNTMLIQQFKKCSGLLREPGT